MKYDDKVTAGVDGAVVLWLVLLMTLALGVAGVVLVTLKLTHVIEWSWLWVTVPIWGPVWVAMMLAALLFVFVLVMLWLDQ
jgi:hypothetical protein